VLLGPARAAKVTVYGLAGTVWTSDAARGMDIARRVHAGTYGVNTYTVEVAAPFGGYKDSGVGRELGPEGLRAYLQPKTIVTNRRAAGDVASTAS
jgi:betaine-aldehyde dehydrogenase